MSYELLMFCALRHGYKTKKASTLTAEARKSSAYSLVVKSLSHRI